VPFAHTPSDRYTQTLAATGLHSYDELTWRVQPAPGPDEIVWKNLKLTHMERIIRSTMMMIVFWLIVAFYLPLCAALQAVVNIDNLERWVPGVALLMKIPFVAEVIKGILPGKWAAHYKEGGDIGRRVGQGTSFRKTTETRRIQNKPLVSIDFYFNHQ
jgi:hypothetical protein